jgi:hypothetical protein
MRTSVPCTRRSAEALIPRSRHAHVRERTVRQRDLAWRHVRPLLLAIAPAVAAWVVLTGTVFLIPVAVWLAVRWALVAPVVVLERGRAVPAIRRSGELVRGRWIRVASLVGVSGALALLLGPLLAAALIFATDLPLGFLNVAAGVVYSLAMPFVALVTAYVYFDSRTRFELEPRERVAELPAEIQLDAS